MQVGTQRRVQRSTCFLLLPDNKLLSLGVTASPTGHDCSVALGHLALCKATMSMQLTSSQVTTREGRAATSDAWHIGKLLCSGGGHEGC